MIGYSIEKQQVPAAKRPRALCRREPVQRVLPGPLRNEGVEYRATVSVWTSCEGYGEPRTLRQTSRA